MLCTVLCIFATCADRPLPRPPLDVRPLGVLAQRRWQLHHHPRVLHAERVQVLKTGLWLGLYRTYHAALLLFRTYQIPTLPPKGHTRCMCHRDTAPTSHWHRTQPQHTQTQLTHAACAPFVVPSVLLMCSACVLVLRSARASESSVSPRHCNPLQPNATLCPGGRALFLGTRPSEWAKSSTRAARAAMTTAAARGQTTRTTSTLRTSSTFSLFPSLGLLFSFGGFGRSFFIF